MSPRQKEAAPEFLALQRKQLDSLVHRDAPVGSLETPPRGWIHTIRTALGMTQAQLARRLGMRAPSVSALEKREAAGTATVATLRQAAEALDCELRIAFVPRTGLQRAVEEQARRKAIEERNRIVHSMRLEAQDSGVARSLAEAVDAESWLTGGAREIWD
ncbi:MAG: mobile mystery protein A [Gemmatimonadaceae bacterium]